MNLNVRYSGTDSMSIKWCYWRDAYMHHTPFTEASYILITHLSLVTHTLTPLCPSSYILHLTLIHIMQYKPGIYGGEKIWIKARVRVWPGYIYSYVLVNMCTRTLVELLQSTLFELLQYRKKTSKRIHSELWSPQLHLSDCMWQSKNVHTRQPIVQSYNLIRVPALKNESIS